MNFLVTLKAERHEVISFISAASIQRRNVMAMNRAIFIAGITENFAQGEAFCFYAIKTLASLFACATVNPADDVWSPLTLIHGL